MAAWQWGQVVRMKIIATTLPLYWLMVTCLPPAGVMARSSGVRGMAAASTAGAAKANAARVARTKRRSGICSQFNSAGKRVGLTSPVSPRQLQLNRPDAECIVERVSDTDAGENQCHRQAVGTDPFRRQAVTVGARDTPRIVARAGCRGVIMEDGGPRPPRLRRVEDTPIAGGIIGERQQIALDPGVIDHIGTAAIPRICEHGAGAGDVGGPYDAPVLVQVLEKLPRGTVRDASLGNARDDESIIAFIRTGTVLRIGVDEIVARAAIIASEIQECG